MSTSTGSHRCPQLGCTGIIEDGYCNVCGTPLTASFEPSSLSRAQSPGSSVTARTSSSRLATQALGSARSTNRTRRLGTSSTRSRGRSLGQGLTTVPPTPVADPLTIVMKDPQVPESRRYCSSCGTEVGRGQGAVLGRSNGFCPSCGTRFDFRPQLQPGALVGGQYQVVGCLAHGGMGWLYLAQDRNVSDRWVVLKGLLNSGDEDAVAAAIAERQFLAEVDHSLIVQIYNFATHDGAGYIVMEYVGGASLKEILKERRTRSGLPDPLPVDQALAYVLEVLPAFSYLHDRGLLYCDFKPDNLVSQADAIKLIDLGGVRRVDDQYSAIFGTIGYQAPEVAQTGPTVASDIFTIGRTLATLVLDFRGNTTTYATTLPPVSQTPLFSRYDSFYRMLSKACAPDPNDRFATVEELRVQMLGVLRDVVALQTGLGRAATNSTNSEHFTAPGQEDPQTPMLWSQLPRLQVDELDPMASWLSGVKLSDPLQRFAVLDKAPQRTAEVLLAQAYTALEAERPDLAYATIGRLLDDDPWEWRAAWMSGLVALAAGNWASAQASFNAVYGQVPGETSPKLALATACELAGEMDIAESLYLICAATDSNYTSAAAFGLSRLRVRRNDLDAALAALDLVDPSRGGFSQARLTRARTLATSGRGITDLVSALDGIDQLAIDQSDRIKLRLEVLESALDLLLHFPHVGAADARVGGVAVVEDDLRDAVEEACRELGRTVPAGPERIALIDRANAVRRWTSR